MVEGGNTQHNLGVRCKAASKPPAGKGEREGHMPTDPVRLQSEEDIQSSPTKGSGPKR